ncbi:MAG TPA: porin [Planctomycetota bacterium]|nr:porin [Planctomycetota bacterium]
MSKSIPCGLMAFAAAASLLPGQESKPAVGGWSSKPGAGLKYDGGDAFSLTVLGRIQVHYTYSANESFGSAAATASPGADTSSFNIRRARLNLTGHVFDKNITYAFILDAVDATSPIKRAWVQWNFASSETGKMGMRVGQAKTVFGLESAGSSGSLWFVERSSASRAFSDVNSRGAWFNGVMGDNKLRWSAGAMNTEVAGGLGGAGTDSQGLSITGSAERGEETANSDNELSYVISANFDPLGDFFDGKQTIEAFKQGDWRTDKEDTSLKGTVGVGVAIGNGKTDSPAAIPVGNRPDIESTSLNFNTAWTVSKLYVLGEYFMRTDDLQRPAATDEEEAMGYAVSVGYLLPKSGESKVQWGVGVRYNYIETDDGTPGSGVDFLTGAQGIGSDLGEVSELSVVLNAFYHGHACKTQIEYTMQDVDAEAANFDRKNHLVRVAFQLDF